MSPDSSPAEFARALREQRRRRSRRRLVVGASVGGVFLVFGGLLALAWFSPWFLVREQRVDGVSLLTADEVVVAAAVAEGTPLVALDVGNVEARVAALPPVAEVDVTRRLPDVVEFAVTERTRAFVREVDAGFDWVDATGTVFHSTPEPPEGAVVAEVDPEADERLLSDVATVVAHLPSEVASRVERLDARAVDQIAMSLEDGATVVWGSAEQSGFKAEVLGALLATEADVYDVSAPGYPTTR